MWFGYSRPRAPQRLGGHTPLHLALYFVWSMVAASAALVAASPIPPIHPTHPPIPSFAWMHAWKQGRLEIRNVKVNIEVNRITVQQIDCRKSERSLGVHMSPALVWDEQFLKMREKMIEAVFKLKNTKIAAPTAYLHYNMHLIKKVCFGCGIAHLTE